MLARFARGSAYVLHWYGVPRLANRPDKRTTTGLGEIAGKRQKKRSLARPIYLVECTSAGHLRYIEQTIGEIQNVAGVNLKMIVIDDCSASVTVSYRSKIV